MGNLDSEWGAKVTEKTIYIGIANQKGGVGKTTLAVHIAAWLSRKQYRVCVIDADPQGNATSWLLGEIPAVNGLVQLLIAEQPVIKVCQVVSGEWNVALVPGNWKTGKALGYQCDGLTPFSAVSGLLHKLDGVVNYVLIDMPPSRNVGFLELLFACDLVLVPTDLARFGVEGIYLMAQALGQIAELHGSAPRLLGVVPNKFRKTRIEKARLLQLANQFGASVWPPIPLAVAVQEACGQGKSLFEAAPGAKVTRAMVEICKRVEENSR